MMVLMATTTMLAMFKAKETRTKGQGRTGRITRPPKVKLPGTVATSVSPALWSRFTAASSTAPEPVGREERELARLLAELLPEDA